MKLKTFDPTQLVMKHDSFQKIILDKKVMSRNFVLRSVGDRSGCCLNTFHLTFAHVFLSCVNPCSKNVFDEKVMARHFVLCSVGERSGCCFNTFHLTFAHVFLSCGNPCSENVFDEKVMARLFVLCSVSERSGCCLNTFHLTFAHVFLLRVGIPACANLVIKMEFVNIHLSFASKRKGAQTAAPLKT